MTKLMRDETSPCLSPRALALNLSQGTANVALLLVECGEPVGEAGDLALTRLQSCDLRADLECQDIFSV